MNKNIASLYKTKYLGVHFNFSSIFQSLVMNTILASRDVVIFTRKQCVCGYTCYTSKLYAVPLPLPLFTQDFLSVSPVAPPPGYSSALYSSGS